MELELTICGIREVLDNIAKAQRSGNPFDAVISFEDPDAEPGRGAPRLAEVLGDKWQGQQLILKCFDAERPGPGMPAPGPAIVGDAVEFVKKLPSPGARLKILVHCRGGFGRSPALGLVLLRLARGPGTESECLDELLRLSPSAMPNMAIVVHGDRILECDGRLNRIFEHPAVRNNRKWRVQFGV